jgi:hypothetical protein
LANAPEAKADAEAILAELALYDLPGAVPGPQRAFARALRILTQLALRIEALDWDGTDPDWALAAQALREAREALEGR